jgi:hypothetical protein
MMITAMIMPMIITMGTVMVTITAPAGIITRRRRSAWRLRSASG